MFSNVSIDILYCSNIHFYILNIFLNLDHHILHICEMVVVEVFFVDHLKIFVYPKNLLIVSNESLLLLVMVIVSMFVTMFLHYCLPIHCLVIDGEYLIIWINLFELLKAVPVQSLVNLKVMLKNIIIAYIYTMSKQIIE